MVEGIKKEIKKEKAKYYFRGQVNPWRLTSSIGRSHDIEKDKRETYYFIDWLKENRYVNMEGRDVDLNELMAVAQHYGYATDFIDFTTDLDVAAYFATDFESMDNLPENACGCMWCVSEDEITCMQEIFKGLVENGTITDENVIRIFKENPKSPFFEYDFKGLSRVKNQKGLFLWDYKGIFTQVYFGGPDVMFEHTSPRAYCTGKINRDFIYPKPNALEREIERYGYEKRARQNHESEEFKQIEAKVYYIKCEEPPKEYDEWLVVKSWNDEEWRELNEKHHPNHEQFTRKKAYIESSYDELSQLKNISLIVKTFREEFENEIVLEYECKEKVLGTLINEVLQTMSYYPYSDEQISECLFYTIKYAMCSLQCFEARNGFPWDQEVTRMGCFVNHSDVAQKVYGNDIIQIELEDEMNVVSRCFVKEEFLGQKAVNGQLVDVTHLMRTIRNPRRLFDFKEICELFVKYLLPYQFIYRPEMARIYIPSFVRVLGWA
jgi:hypothetical protein